MAISWSKEQLQAIQSHDTNELLNAGAGSGKTAVLSEHVIYLLQHGYDLDQLLIMTFTNAAANEMKQRIKQKIEDHPDLNEKYGDEIESAHIETFDAFYLYLVKKYHYIFNLDQNISILDGNIEKVLKARFIANLLDEYYVSDNQPFKNFVKKYCVKNDNVLYDAINLILDQASLAIDKDEFLNNYLSHFFTEEYLNQIIDKRYSEMKEKLSIIKNAAEKLENDKDKNSILDFISSFDECKNYDELFYKTSTQAFPKKIGGVSSDEIFRKKIKTLYEETFSLTKADYGLTNEIKDCQYQVKEDCELLFEIARKVDSKSNEFKHKFNSFTFSDIANMALKLFNMPEILKEIKAKFRYILIDEYQDTNDIQEEVVKKIEDDNVFMVGDVKQSIYRFRNANCLIFQEKYNRYKHFANGGHVIDMTNNFRSREELVSGFNDYFNQLMDKRYNLIDYSDGHITNFGFKDYQNATSKDIKNGIYFYKYSKTALKGDVKYSACEYEARIIVNDIIKKINEGYQVYDKSSPNKLRKCMFKDFAIIIDRGTHFDDYKRVFGEYSVPLFIYNDEDVHKNLIFTIAPNLLKLYKGIKNNEYDTQFRHAFISIARSFIVNQSDEEIFNIVRNNKYDESSIVIKIKEIIKKHDQEPVCDIFRILIEEFDVFNKLTTVGDYNYNVSDIETFNNLIASMDSFNFNLDEVIDYFNDLDIKDDEIKSSPIKESDNSVILLNIHKSKGLEYPIVYYPGMTVNFNRDSLSANIIISKKYGPILPITPDGRPQLSRKLNKDYEIIQDYEEKLRLLYVALTRAKEAAIIVDQYGEDEIPLMDPRDAKNFHDMLKGIVISGKDVIIDKTNTSFNNELKLIDIKNSDLSFTLKDKPIVDYQEINKARASKIANGDVNQDALDFGNKMHLLMELCDMDSKDLSYIKSEKEREYVKNVINLDIFKGIDNDHIRHEFPFYDDTNHMLGIIDCLIIRDDEVDIIDFKLKNIDDDAYQKQLQAYYDYIKLITDKKIKTYLISIIDAKVQEVKVNE